MLQNQQLGQEREVGFRSMAGRVGGKRVTIWVTRGHKLGKYAFVSTAQVQGFIFQRISSMCLCLRPVKWS